ncbi:hypothetical protein CcarbDRAFT_5259 [Clostridium carboxidivorans P7]|uniref:BFD-like [2Fe-2S]-binding domain-containing protein n=1 Tax=Clostridium carboxidivorans P7 TaxID=536227 RepID=C6Q2J1_9CLOT|nr:hypothetical protein CcarbDRAFT_5259 [Clostridium carboxidivorans P7]
MEQNLNEKIKDKLTKVCLCKAISRASIKNAINSGATSVEEVKKLQVLVLDLVMEKGVSIKFKH